jgi:hypothetical protein
MRFTPLHIAFVVVFFVMGLPYWRIPYSSASLPNSLWSPAMLVVLAAPVAVLVLSKNTFARTSGVIGLAVPAMVMARVVVEAFQNPTTHKPLAVRVGHRVGSRPCGGFCRIAGRPGDRQTAQGRCRPRRRLSAATLRPTPRQSFERALKT